MKTFTVRFVMRSRFENPDERKVHYINEVIQSKDLKSLWEQISQMFYLDGIEGLGETSRDVVWIKDEGNKIVYGDE